MSKEPTINVLYVDDESVNLIGFKANFRRYYNVFTALSAVEAKEILATTEIHVLITDQRMPHTIGTKLLEDTIQEYPQQSRILLTAYADNESLIDAFKKGLLYKFVLKPYDSLELKEIIDAAYEFYSLNRLKDNLYKEWLKTQEDFILLKSKGIR